MAKFKSFNEVNNNGNTFEQYTKKIRKKNVLNTVNNRVKLLNKLCCSNVKILPTIILSGFLIKNYSNDFVWALRDKHPIDIYILDLSRTLTELFTNE